MGNAPPHGERRPFDETSFAEVFDAVGVGREQLGLDALEPFAVQLATYQPMGWFALDEQQPTRRWLSTVIGAYDGASDWAEVSVSLRTWCEPDWRSQGQGQRLWAIQTSLEVACWCVPDHNMHTIEQITSEVGSPSALHDACDHSLTVVRRWLAQGLTPADHWRRRAGLPLARQP